MVERFDAGDDEYMAWMRANADGYVVNTTRRKSPYFVVHLSGCTHISTYGHLANGAFTERQYIKLCSADILEVTRLAEESEADIKYCATCNAGIADPFYTRVTRSISDRPDTRRRRLENAPPRPQRRLATTWVFDRNPDVVAERLLLAKGQCELCHSDAPFLRKSDDRPYLEVHHIERLIDGGLDTVENTIALCPNCHRREHFGPRSKY